MGPGDKSREFERSGGVCLSHRAGGSETRPSLGIEKRVESTP
jgi:hypothetical protein